MKSISRRALPQAKLYGLDLSPYYARRARQVLDGVQRAAVVVENAERMPWADGYFDAVTSLYLFHELPSAVRRRVMGELARVVRPGGAVVVCDSAQLVDSHELKIVLTGFPASYHEPYYKGYLRDDLEHVVGACGLELERSETYLLSKVVTARKRGRNSRSGQRKR